MWEARAQPGRAGELAAQLRDATHRDRLRAVDGFLGAEVFVSYDGPDRVVVVSRWRDEAALEAFAGTQWRDRPVVDREAAPLLAREPAVWHFVPAG